MCTAIAYRDEDRYLGRNLDVERGYGERIVITPRNAPLRFRCADTLLSHYAMIGMATVVDRFPLYYDAINEKGLGMAALAFRENAYYPPYIKGKKNIAPFELIPFVLGVCSNMEEVRALVETINLVKIDFSEEMPLSPLHFMISDQKESMVLESVKEGLFLYENPFEVLTNNPPFPFHTTYLSHYTALHTGNAEMKFDLRYPLKSYSYGMGAMGLPGDFSSASRFVRAFFVKENSLSFREEQERVCHLFHILSSVAMPKGCVLTENGYEYTRYTAWCNLDRGIYYYSTYDQLAIQAVSLWDFDLERDDLFLWQVESLT